MNVHTTLLNQLQAFEARFGVKVVPRDEHNERALSPEDDGGFFWEHDDPRLGRDILDHDAHAHIERGGLEAVMWWCWLKGWGGVFLGKHGDVFSVEGRNGFSVLGTGPTLEAAYLAAVRGILKGETK